MMFAVSQSMQSMRPAIAADFATAPRSCWILKNALADLTVNFARRAS
jgi:hypothetical protein